MQYSNAYLVKSALPIDAIHLGEVIPRHCVFVARREQKAVRGVRADRRCNDRTRMIAVCLAKRLTGKINRAMRIKHAHEQQNTLHKLRLAITFSRLSTLAVLTIPVSLVQCSVHRTC